MIAQVHDGRMQSSIDQYMRTARLGVKLSQREVGRLCGLPQSEISKIEAGKRLLNMTVFQWSRLFGALRLTPDQRAEAWALLDQAAVQVEPELHQVAA